MDSDRDRFTARGVLYRYSQVLYRYSQVRYRYSQVLYRYSQVLYRYSQVLFIWQEGASSTVPPTLVYFAVLQLGLSQCIVSYTVQPLSPPSVNYLRHQFVAKHTLLSSISDLDILFPGAITMTRLAFLFWMLSLVSC